MPGDNLTEDEIKDLRSCPTPDHYAVVARRIKEAHGGRYPQDWFAVVLKEGGIASELKEKWKDPTAFDIGVEKVIKP